jgi:hypothetical protein
MDMVYLLLSVMSMGMAAGATETTTDEQPVASLDGTIIKKTLGDAPAGMNLLKADGWVAWQKGFDRQSDAFVCDNGGDTSVQRGASQTITLNQTRAEPLIAETASKAEGVGGSRDSDYSLYLDLVYSDGTPLWGQVDSFHIGTHDWEPAKVIVYPEKPIKSVSFHLLLRSHSGKAWFRNPSLRVIEAPTGMAMFDGVAVSPAVSGREGFIVRDVKAEGDFVAIDQDALGLRLASREKTQGGATILDVTLTDTTGKDRAITLVYAATVAREDCLWLADPRRSEPVQKGREYLDARRFAAGANGRLSRYPFAAVAGREQGLGLGIDMRVPAFYRAGYNADTQELFLAFDIGLTGEKPSAQLRLCRFSFDPAWGFRGALQRYYELFADSFACRIQKQGLWMPFASISKVPQWEDFGFRFKEGTDETGWDDQHDILTFRYTEPMTWWMAMPKGMPRTIEAALAEARRLANEKNDPAAKALVSSGYHDENGQFVALMQDTPWCNGAVWSINSMPGIVGEVTDFSNKWNPKIREQLYGPQRKADQDGEYIDSSEGYVTDELDYRRDHFAAARAPLVFSLDSRMPAIFRGLIAQEYVRAIAEDMHADGHLMMANATPDRLCWLAPHLDVMGTETDWNPGKTWRPMSDGELLYRRAICGRKPYCFLMNTVFEDFPKEKVELYMKRSLAYGMFPGFFSHNASEGHYFSRPELYERDRELFRKYVPLCRRLAEAGWQPITQVRSSNPQVFVERFGDKLLTVFNDSRETRQTTLTRADTSGVSKELVRQTEVRWAEGKATLSLEAEDVAVLELP